ncbi:Glycosyltransferase involved in cell wall bisynthesis [Pseudomonas pohangensis]|uniref:Glycosyltransferase involved in cell wall bisynthesis n=1 Tax=Pseudomonas pohangensis TaxID=364197 RepID=A0A1H2H0X1_9PSED|nr:glycosyltransferase family 4 protein [Pseudomonas pohangensis]SDU25494.1 Glycosyltransferase involved in cell wall bisynthesis [Pseudomonas pohangensis]
MGNTVQSRRFSVHMLVWNDFCNDARVLKEAQTLQAVGYSVVVHAVHVPGKTAQKEYLDDGIEVRRVSLSPFKNKSGQSVADAQRQSLVVQVLSRVWAHLSMFRRLAFSRADVIHAHDVNTLPTAWLAAKVSRAKLVYDAHEISSSREGYTGVRTLVSCVERFLMPRAHGCITTTDMRAKFFARAYGIARPVVLQNRPRLSHVARSQRIKDELGLHEPWPVVVYQGGLQQGRGLERLVRVAANVPGAYFVFIGGGRLEAPLRKLADELELAHRVLFIPTVSLADLPEYSASADIGVQPIENTCFNHFTTDSNKLFEYVQARLPVVASAFPEIRRVLRTHDLGILVPAGNCEALEAALRELVVDETERRYYSARAQQAAAALSWESQEFVLIGLYDQILR